MKLRCHCRYLVVFILLLMNGLTGFSQCSPQNGPGPSNQIFNTGSNGIGGVLLPNKNDLHWTVTVDSINGVYYPAVVMDSLPPDYYKSPWPDCRWISISRNGQQVHDHTFFFKMDFQLPCNNPCGDSYDKPNTFCLTLDMLADNSVFEIYINGGPQSNRLGGIIPVKPDPYHATGLNLNGMISVPLCSNWKSGRNSLVIEVASSAPVTGLLAQASTVFSKPISNAISASICQNESYAFGRQSLTTSGLFYESFKTISGCDSTVALQLKVKTAISSQTDTTICEGESFFGHTTAGTFTDTLKAANGCDSLHIIQLAISPKPHPDFGSNNVLCTGSTIDLYPGKFSSYLWQDNTTKDHFNVKAPGAYSVTVTNTCGSGSAQINVSEKDCAIYFPTAFTPNSDGKNDVFKVLTNYLFEYYQLTVYNRFGQVVFTSKNSLQGWSGNINGLPQQSGVYAWKCRYKKSGIITDINGTVMLVR